MRIGRLAALEELHPGVKAIGCCRIGEVGIGEQRHPTLARCLVEVLRRSEEVVTDRGESPMMDRRRRATGEELGWSVPEGHEVGVTERAHVTIGQIASIAEIIADIE